MLAGRWLQAGNRLPGQLATRALSTEAEPCLYSVLGVPSNATDVDIKRAFRQQAKRLHPDALNTGGASSGAAFAQLVAAYQVLSSPEQRQLYDLSRNTAASRWARAAAASATDSTSGAAGVHAEWGWGFGRMAWAHDVPARTGGSLDALRSELRGELHAALRHAYLGPRVDMSTGQLPQQFEGDERSTRDTDEVLHLVSGRQRLGTVRLRATPLVPERSSAPAAVPARGLHALPTSAAGGPEHSHARAAHHQRGVFAGSHNGQAAPLGFDASPSRQPGASARPPPTVLELLIGDEPVAVAVRPAPPLAQARSHSASSQHSASSSSASTAPDTDRARAAQPSSGGAHRSQGHATSAASPSSRRPAPAPQQAGPPALAVYSAGGQLLSWECGGRLRRGGAARATHGVVRGATLLVRHLELLTLGPEPRSVGRAKRAWLPPAATWLFPPAHATHASGGWFFEWPGHINAGHPAWLDPAVLVLTAAFNTLDHETACEAKHRSWLRRALSQGLRKD